MTIKTLLICLPLALGAGCGDDTNGAQKDASVIDAPVHVDASVDAAPVIDASCFTNPTTNNEIINACTDADKIYKNSHPPLLGSDGSLPALPQ